MPEQESKQILSEEERRNLTTSFLEEFSHGDPKEVIVSWDANGNLEKILPEVSALKGTLQRVDHHMEGDVWNHTLLVLTHLFKIHPDASLDLRFEALFHDIGKPSTTVEDLQRGFVSKDHSQVGANIAEQIIDRITLNNPGVKINKEKIIWAIKSHLIGQGSGGEILREATIKKYFLREDGWGQDLLTLLEVDTYGREAVDNRSKWATLDALKSRIKDIQTREVRPATPLLPRVFLPIPDGPRIIELFNLVPSPAVGQIREALKSICQELKITGNRKGDEVARLLANMLNLDQETRRIPDENLEFARSQVVSRLLRDLEYNLGEVEINVLVNNDPDPLVKKEIDGQLEKYPLNRKESRLLVDQRVGIIILGVPRCGKTSFVHRLTTDLGRLEGKLPFNISVTGIDLDRSLLALTKLQGGEVQGKRRWEELLVREAEREFEWREENIILADGPGGGPDRITERLVRHAKCAIIFTKGDNDPTYLANRRVYSEFLRVLSIPLIASFRSRPYGQVGDLSGREIKSELRVFNPGKFIGGQVVGLEYGEANDDPVIEDIAKAMLFSILPAVQERKII